MRAHDAHVPADARLGPPTPRVECSVEEISAADLVVLCVDHPDLPYDDIAEHARLVLPGAACGASGSAARRCSHPPRYDAPIADGRACAVRSSKAS